MGNNPSNLRPRNFDGTALQPKDVPPPVPCKTRKEAALAAFDFKVLDQHAIKAPNSLLKKTWWDLVDYLTDNDSFDTLAKVRSIFRWITSYDIENFEIGESPPANSPLEYFGKIQSDMGDYANLFFILCSVAHVKCVVIDGITKSTAYDVGEPMNKENMKAHWNAVYVKKEWRLVDCFWASTTDFVDEGNVTRNDKNRFTKVTTYTKLEDDDGDHDADDDEVHNDEPNEFYFFTDPDQLINTHLPRDPKWQLLIKPISDQEFEEQAYLRERFLKMEIKITNEKFDKCKIIAKDGEARVQFRLPPERSPYYRFKYIMYKSDRYGDTNKKIDTVLDRFIIFQHTKERLKLSLRFPVAGKFQLDIFGLDKENYKLFDLLCTYVFECNVPVSDCYPLPDNPLIGWGPGVDSEAFGVVPITHPDAIIETEDGKLEIRIQGKKELALYMALKNPFISNGNLTKYAMLRWREGEYIINTRLPKEGEYALNLYVRDQDGKKQSHNVMNYLLKCTGKDIKETPYPNLAQENLGAHPEAEALGVKCIGCEDGFVEAKEGKAKVEFQTKDDLQLLCELHANNVDSPERLRVAPNIVNGRQAFALDLPLEGEYAMNVFGLLRNNPQKIHNIHALLVHSGGRPIQEGTKRRTGTGTKNFWKDIGQMDIEVINTKDSEVIVPVPFGVPHVVAFLERKGSGQPPSSKNVEIIKEEGVPLYKLKLEEYGEYTFNIYQRDDGVFIRNFMRYIIRRNLKDVTAVENDLDVIMSTIKEERIKEGYDVSGIDSRKEDFIEHKKQRVDVGQKVAAARQLQKVMDTKNPTELKKAMDEYKDASKTKSGVMDDPLLASANKQYKTIKAKYDLTSAYQNRELTDLDKAISQAKKAKDPSLDVQILLAQRLRERIAVMRRIRDTVMKTDPKTINEIRKYNTPPDGAHQSIAAALLLTGFPLKEVEDWKQCQKHLAKRGNDSVRTKMANFNPRKVPKGNAEYAKGMMDEVTLSQVEKSCPMASAFCKWAKQKLKQIEEEVGPLESVPSDLDNKASKKGDKGNKDNIPAGQKTNREKEQKEQLNKPPSKTAQAQSNKGKIVPLAAAAQKGAKTAPGKQPANGKRASPTNKGNKNKSQKSIPLIVQLDENDGDKLEVKAIIKQPVKKPQPTKNGYANPKDKRQNGKSSQNGVSSQNKVSNQTVTANQNTEKNQTGIASQRQKDVGNQDATDSSPIRVQSPLKRANINQNGLPRNNKGRIDSDSSHELNFTPSELTMSEVSTDPEANVITFEDLFTRNSVNVKVIKEEPNPIKGPKGPPVVKEQKPNVSYLARHHLKSVLQPSQSLTGYGNHNPRADPPIRKQINEPDIPKPKIQIGYAARHQMKKTSLA